MGRHGFTWQQSPAPQALNHHRPPEALQVAVSSVKTSIIPLIGHHQDQQGHLKRLVLRHRSLQVATAALTIMHKADDPHFFRLSNGLATV